MRFDAKERLAEGDIASNVHDGVGGTVVKLQAIEVKEPSKKGVDQKLQTTKEVGEEDDSLTGAGFQYLNRVELSHGIFNHGGARGGHIGGR